MNCKSNIIRKKSMNEHKQTVWISAEYNSFSKSTSEGSLSSLKTWAVLGLQILFPNGFRFWEDFRSEKRFSMWNMFYGIELVKLDAPKRNFKFSRATSSNLYIKTYMFEYIIELHQRLNISIHTYYSSTIHPR